MKSKYKGIYTKAVRLASCPFCQSEIGVPCTYVNGFTGFKRFGATHKARLDKAEIGEGKYEREKILRIEDQINGGKIKKPSRQRQPK